MIFWVASYPKSGNTWLRTLLCSYYFSSDGFFSQKLLEKIRQFPEKKYFRSFNYNSNVVTDTSKFWIKAQELINSDNKLKFFKTHNILGTINKNKFTNKENTLGGIYIVRDPRNVITSIQNHYEFSKEEALEFVLNEKKYIHDFNLKNDFGDFQLISSWERNYQSWIKQNIFPVKAIKYEDLEKNTFEIFRDIIEFIENITGENRPFDTKKAKNAIGSTSFEKMKNLENTTGFVEAVESKKNSKKIPFFYLGPKNDWKNIFDYNYQKKLNSIFETNLKELNYFK